MMLGGSCSRCAHRAVDTAPMPRVRPSCDLLRGSLHSLGADLRNEGHCLILGGTKAFDTT